MGKNRNTSCKRTLLWTNQAPSGFTHLLGADDKVSSSAKTWVGIGHSGDSDDDGKGEETLGNHFVLWLDIYFVMKVCCVRLLSSREMRRTHLNPLVEDRLICLNF